METRTSQLLGRLSESATIAMSRKARELKAACRDIISQCKQEDQIKEVLDMWTFAPHYPYPPPGAAPVPHFGPPGPARPPHRR